MRKWVADWLVLPTWRIIDHFTPKDFNCWAFVVHHLKSDQFVENSRAVFEAVKADPLITKIIFTRGIPHTFELDGKVNTHIVDLQSIEGLKALRRCGVLFVTHSVTMDFSMRWPPRLFSVVKPSLRGRLIINLWHGIPLKKLLALANERVRNHTDRLSFRRRERAHYAGLISSSAMDSHAMAAMFHPLHYDQMWVTGLPRTDFLVQPEALLPSYLREGLMRLQALKGKRRLIVYAPTYRQMKVSGASYYSFNEDEILDIRKLLERHDVVLGLRLHYFKNADQLFNFESMIDNDRVVELDHDRFPDISCVLRGADLVVTDYSSVYVDALFIEKPVFSFAYDYDHYRAEQDGLLYDMDIVFPGPLVQTSQALIEALDEELTSPSQTSSDRYRTARKVFFDHFDDRNTERVLERVRRAMRSRLN